MKEEEPVNLNRKTIRDIDVSSKRVLVRVDYNVPLDDSGSIADDLRIRASLPTLRNLRERHAKLVVMSHLGRPKGAVNPAMSLKPVAERLSQLLETGVVMAPDCIGSDVRNLAEAMKPGDILLLENLRFHPGETKNDRVFASELASLGELFVNDAFGTAHRAHASTAGVPEIMGAGVAGFLMEQELQFFGRVLENPTQPFLAILGGAKISGKIEVLKKLLTIADIVFVGGAMANTFFLTKGLEIGKSLVEKEAIGIAEDALAEADRLNKKLLLPSDVVIAPDLAATDERKEVSIREVEPDSMILDIGSDSISQLRKACLDARTIFWNGPMGVFEKPPFDAGTVAAARALVEATEHGAVSVVGGGDSASALNKAGCSDKVSHLSTGGGASLELVEGKDLPGIMVLEERS